MSRWRPALRIARRTVRSGLGRSLLIAVLVGLPVAGATFVDILVRTFSDAERSTYQQIGPADAELMVTASKTLTNFQPMANGAYVGRPGHDRRLPAAVDLSTELPKGSTWTEFPRTFELRLTVDGDRIVRPSVVVADLTSPLTGYEASLTEGTLPSSVNEVVVTEPLAKRLDLLDDEGKLVDEAKVTVDEGPTAVVTGLVEAPFCLACEKVVAAPGSFVAAVVEDDQNFAGKPPYSYLVDLPPDVDADALWPRLAENGLALTPRAAYLDPDKYSGYDDPGLSLTTPSAVRAAALALLITGLGLLEVVLLAGTAFAVGARRQVHDLGVISASGATSRQVRRIVLAQGLVLGIIGSAIGIAFGTVAALAGRSFWEHLDNGVVFAWKFGPGEILVAAAVGALSGVLAAVVPAIGAGRMTTVDALSGRFRVSAASKRRTPVIGGLLVVTGGVAGLVGDQLMAGDFAAYVKQLARANETGAYVSPPSPTTPVGLVLLGAVLAVVGMVVLAPLLITTIGRVAGRLPLSGRLAFRDASRHRHRTGPATSAIAVAVAGSVVLAFVLAGQARANELSYVASLPPDVMSVSDSGYPGDEHLVRAGAEEAAAVLPGGTVVQPRRVTAGSVAKSRDTQEIYVLLSRKACRSGCASVTLGVADTSVIALALGRPPTDDEKAQLAAGKALVLSPHFVNRDGELRFEIGEGTERLATVVADVPRLYGSLPAVFVSADVVRERGWGTIAPESLVPFDSSASPAQLDDAKTAAEGQGAIASLDTGPSDPSRILLVLAGLAAAFVTLVGVAISVALSAAEGRADLATLAAVGAPPRRRRSLAAAQALLVGGLGCAVGLVLGIFVAYTLRSTIGAPTFVVPWGNLLVVGIVVPLLAVLIAAVFTPGRLPLTVRRSW